MLYLFLDNVLFHNLRFFDIFFVHLQGGVHFRSQTYTLCNGEGEKLLPSLVPVRYLYQPGELEGGTKRATDPIWSLKVYRIKRSFTKHEQPVLYYLRDGPKLGFVCKELLVIPPNTQLPPEQL